MDYECVLRSVVSLNVNPLCNGCQAPDCTNPIRERVVSVVGIPTKMRLFVVGNVVRQVVSCTGYVGRPSTPTT